MSFSGALLSQILRVKKAREECNKEQGVSEETERIDHAEDFQPAIKEHPYTKEDAVNEDKEIIPETSPVPFGKDDKQRLPMSEITRAVMYGRKSIVTGGSRYRAQLSRMAELRSLQHWSKFLQWVDALRVKLRAGANRPPRVVVSEFGIVIGTMRGEGSFEVWADPEEKLRCSCRLAERMAESDSDDLINFQFGMCIHVAAVEFKELWRIPVYTNEERTLMREDFPPERSGTE